jgi:15-cis-phytoene synthase
MDKAAPKNGVKIPLTTISWTPDVELALHYAGAEMAALMRFDRTLAQTVSQAKDPALAQLRLAWWRTQLEAPVAGNEGYETIRLFGARLLPVIDGWEQLLAPLPLSEAALTAYGEGRGDIFAILGGDARAGAGWALADFARHCSDPVTAERARQLAEPMLRSTLRQAKPLRVLTSLAKVKNISRWTLLRAALS